MWWPTFSTESLTRPRVTVAIISAAAAISLGYYNYYQNTTDQDIVGDQITGHGLHRSNAVRRRRRRPRQNSRASSSSGQSGDGNLGTEPPTLEDGETIVENVDEWWNEPAPVPTTQRAGHNIVNLLFRVSEDNARRNACVHRGCSCNACNMSPIKGTRYRCANCADFDLCETCEAQGVHIKSHIFYKIKVSAPPCSSRQMQPVWYTGDPDSVPRNLQKQVMNRLSKETGFERPELEAFWEQWTYMANTELRDDPDELFLAMDRKTFDRCLVLSGGSRHAAPNLIHDRMFSFYDMNNDGLIDFSEFLYALSYRKRQDRLQRIFQGYDIDSDGYVTRKDFLRMFRAYYVLYRQMHKDILDSLDYQFMGSPEARQLVHSRQPLSSIFGREHRVPPADDSTERLLGKTHHPNGDVDLGESSRLVRESGRDTASQEDVLTRLFATAAAYSPRDSYLEGLLDPPSTIGELPDLLIGRRRTSSLNSSDGEDETSDNDEHGSNAENEPGPSTRPTSIEDADASEGLFVDPEQYTSNVPTESQARAKLLKRRRAQLELEDKRRKRAARRQLHERWRKRHFYLDEEEGGMPPEGWEADEDIFTNLNVHGESSKIAQRRTAPLRSRSSSKVRFAEETEDLELRSNTSTSSRSVPERWGGMDIAAADRDAGKEILYQVTQYAFNELLDVIFKDKEDLWEKAALTKEERAKYADILEYIEYKEDDEEETWKSINGRLAERKSKFKEGREIQDWTLEELLEETGYTVDSASAKNAEATVPDSNDEKETVKEDDPPEPTLHRDPTMPQFRPNSTADGATNDHAEPRRDKGKAVAKKSLDLPNRQTLMEWKRLQLAEREAHDRGGWGMLSFAEFEKIFKSQESQGNRLDYLGSWIDFCVP